MRTIGFNKPLYILSFDHRALISDQDVRMDGQVNH